MRMAPSLLAQARVFSVVALAGLFTGLASGQIQENELVVLWNSQDSESQQIRDHYVQVHRDVQDFDLNIDYSTNPDITRFKVKPQEFYDLIVVPLQGFLANPPQLVPLVYAIATTRGVPALITEDFTGGNPSGDSVAGQLARLGYIETAADVGFFSSNPYFQAIGIPFSQILADGCPRGGIFDYAGKMFLVSRLDANGIGMSHVEAVIDLIDRSTNLVVNKPQVVLVYDDKPVCGNIFADKQRAAHFCDAGWCVVIDETDAFLHGNLPPAYDCPCGAVPDCPCGELNDDIESTYAGLKELVHVTLGTNSVPQFFNGNCVNVLCVIPGETPELVCKDYIQFFDPHPAGLFMSAESFNGKKIWGGGTIHGNVLEWIGAGGSFTYGNLSEPGFAQPIWPAALNLYEHGLSWGEAIWSAMPLGGIRTPIGDPLATVRVVPLQTHTVPPCPTTVCDTPPALPEIGCLATIPVYQCVGDLNTDLSVDDDDLVIIESMLGCECEEGDFNGDGIVNQMDLSIFELLRAEYPLAGDVNGNGLLDCEDVTAMPDINCDGVWNLIDELYFWAQRSDFNGDGVVSCDEVQKIASNTTFCTRYNEGADLDCDGDVDADDVAHAQFARAVMTGLDDCIPDICERGGI